MSEITAMMPTASVPGMPNAAALRLLGCCAGPAATPRDIADAVKRFELRLGLRPTGELSDANLLRMEQVLADRGHVDGARRGRPLARRALENSQVTVSGVLRTRGKRAAVTVE